MPFLVAEAAWRKVEGQPYDCAGPLQHARRLGLDGQARLGLRMAAPFEPSLAEGELESSE